MGIFKKIADFLTGKQSNQSTIQQRNLDRDRFSKSSSYEEDNYDDEYDEEDIYYEEDDYDDEENEYDEDEGENDDSFSLENQVESFSFVYNSLNKDGVEYKKEIENFKQKLKSQEIIYNKLITDSFLKKEFEKFLNKNKDAEYVQQHIILMLFLLDYNTYSDAYVSIDVVEYMDQKIKILEDIIEKKLFESEYSGMIYQQQLMAMNLLQKNPYLLTGLNALINEDKELIDERMDFIDEMMYKYPQDTVREEKCLLANQIIIRNMIVINNMDVIDYVNFIEDKTSSYGEDNKIAIYTYALMLLNSFKNVVNSIDKTNYLKKYNISESDSAEHVVKTLLISGLSNEDIEDVVEKCSINLNGIEISTIIKKVLKNLKSRNEYFSDKCEDFRRSLFVKKYNILPEDDNITIQEKVRQYIIKIVTSFDHDYKHFTTDQEIYAILQNFVTKYEDEFKKCNYLSFALVDANKINLGDYIDEYEIDFIEEKRKVVDELCDSSKIENKDYVRMYKYIYDGMEDVLTNLNINQIFHFIQHIINELPKTSEEKNFELSENSINYLIEAIQTLLIDLIDENLITIADDESRSVKFMSLCGVLNYLWINKMKHEKENVINKYDITTNNNQDIVHNLLQRGFNTDKINDILVMVNTDYCNPLDEEFYNPRDFEQLIEGVKKSFDRKQRLYNLSVNQKKKITMSDVDIMSGSEFENFITELFNNMGYIAYKTQDSNDQGIDVIAKKGDDVIAIQTKCYSGSVGNAAIQEAVAGMHYYKADKAMVITNSSFTTSAKNLAQKNNVELWDREILKEKMNSV